MCHLKNRPDVPSKSECSTSISFSLVFPAPQCFRRRRSNIWEAACRDATLSRFSWLAPRWRGRLHCSFARSSLRSSSRSSLGSSSRSSFGRWSFSGRSSSPSFEPTWSRTDRWWDFGLSPLGTVWSSRCVRFPSHNVHSSDFASLSWGKILPSWGFSLGVTRENTFGLNLLFVETHRQRVIYDMSRRLTVGCCMESDAA